MHRLFSNFARGWPGVGLLLIRIVTGASLIIEVVQRLQGGRAIEPLGFDLIAIGVGALLIVGLWTPITGTLVVAISAWQTLVWHEDPYRRALLAAMGAALALVGPGAFSVDSWLFGWKRIDFNR